MSEFREKRSSAYNICVTAVFAALCCVSTFIAVPLPIGYFNLGDIFVLLSGYILGPVFGFIAAGFGSAFADILSSYVIYAPATFIIKACMAIVSALLYRLMIRKATSKWAHILALVLSAFAAELIMVGGYFVFEATFMGYGLGAVASVFGNCLQALSGIVGYLVIVSALRASKIDKKLMR